MIKVKVSQLQDQALDWAVAQALGLPLHKDALLGGELMKGWWVQRLKDSPNLWTPLTQFSPSKKWNQGGPIIECERVNLLCAFNGDEWSAEHRARNVPRFLSGPTPLIAAMRCYVEFKLDNEIDVPEELLT